MKGVPCPHEYVALSRRPRSDNRPRSAERRSNRREPRSGEASELTAGFGRPTIPDERSSGRLRMQTHTERARHFQHGGEARVAVLAKRLI